jgi:hypothetical protein
MSSPHTPTVPFGLRRLGILAALFVTSVGVSVRTIRPIDSGSVGPDAVAPVIEFERLLAGQQVEGHLSQTSKPLLDVFYGLLYGLSGDWRPLVWAAILAFALSVVLAVVLADRVGGLASAAFAAAAFIVSPILLIDLSLAYAITWMLLFLLVAGLAVTSDRPRYGVAGLSLMLAALLRPEVLAVVAVGLGALVVAEVRAVARRRPRPPGHAYLTLLGFLAIPVLIAHDALVFGDPLFWTTTALANSAGRPVRNLLEMIVWMGHHFIGQATLLPLAAAAAYVLVSRRRWPLAIGLAGVVGGIAVLFIVGGARGIFVSSRYLAPIDLGLLFAAAVGVSVLDIPEIRRWAGRWMNPDARRVAWPIVGGLLVAFAVAPIGPLDPSTRASIATQVKLHANAQRALAAIGANLGARPSWQGLPPSQAFSGHPLVIVPPRLRAQAVAELGLPLGEVVYSTYRDFLDPANGKPTPGTIVYHDRLDDKATDPRYKLLEISQPTTIAGRRYVPILVDPAAGMWVLRVEDVVTP